MGRRATGLGFCGIAAFLFASRYISAAIYGSNQTSWNTDLFNGLLVYVGNSLLVLSILSLMVGIIYLVLGEIRK